ncbi:hypothetical protein F5Y16DRAFT_62454 [Xylariaceae sp. FL0255]|nr:hypothetical protein F5Y16DRAFT_62454 [Xylariaceae sp. FL0255]
MMSLWPWKGQDSSPASFEKTLATLSTKITNTQVRVDRARNNSRRIKLLWTLYVTFAYLVYAIVLVLVVGWHNLGAWEWTGLAGGPVLIYIVRTAINAYFTYRLNTFETRLKALQTERANTIQKLKEATKYDSTLQLLEKYGGSGEKGNKAQKSQDGNEKQASAQEKDASKKKHRQSIDSIHGAQRTRMPLPPTANVQRPSTALGIPPIQDGRFPIPQPPQQRQLPQNNPNEEFAPNAGPLSPSYTQYEMNLGPPRWYDRIMDLMMGEDEMAPKNRIVLICTKCRLVNGQAPPGIKDLAEVGTWKCMGCGAKNGELDEGKKIMQQALNNKRISRDETRAAGDAESDRSSDLVKVEQDDNEDSHNTESESDTRQSTQEPEPRRRELRSQKAP